MSKVGTRDISCLSVEDVAKVLDVSPETISRDWRVAKTWLFSELSATSKTAHEQSAVSSRRLDQYQQSKARFHAAGADLVLSERD